MTRRYYYPARRGEIMHHPQAVLRRAHTPEEIAALARALKEARRRQREARQAIEDLRDRVREPEE